MFGLWQWWRSRAARRRRTLFEFWDGRRFRRRDPWVIYRQLYNDEEFVIGKDPSDPADMLKEALALEEPAFSKAVRCVHRAFGTRPYDDARREGLTEIEAVNLLVDFLEWLDGLLKKNAGSPIWSPPTGSASSSGPGSPAPATSSPSASPSSPTASTPGGASWSSTASEVPSSRPLDSIFSGP